jgi:hypothetical protein
MINQLNAYKLVTIPRTGVVGLGMRGAYTLRYIPLPHAKAGAVLILAGGAMYLWQQQAMQNSGQGTDEATAISAGDTNNGDKKSGKANPSTDGQKQEGKDTSVPDKPEGSNCA